MKLEDDLPADLAAEIERYQHSLEAKGQPYDLPNVLHKLIQIGLYHAKAYAFVPVRLPSQQPTAPSSALIAPRQPTPSARRV